MSKSEVVLALLPFSAPDEVLTEYALALEGVDESAAERFYVLAVRQCPRSSALLFHAGKFLRRRGRLRTAIRSLKYSLKLVPFHGATIYELSRCFVLAGSNNEARALVEQAQKMGVKHSGFNAILRRDIGGRLEADD